ncbi:MAG: phage portal protein [Atopobiaceae bacterium]|nr:phage portal protein [Atopobiaceae bacterium]
MGKRWQMLMHPERYVEKMDAAESEKWRELADWLGIDPDGDKDAMKEATYYTCLKVLREAIGRVPIVLNRRAANGSVERAVDHQLYNVLYNRPNRFTTATAFWSAIEQARLHFGNAYALKTGYGTQKSPYELWFMPPNEVEVWWDMTIPIDQQPDIYYIWSSNGATRVFKSREVLHFRSSDSMDGVKGIPLVDRLGNLVGGAMKSQRFQSDLVGSGMTGKAVLQYAGEVNGRSEKVFKQHIEKYMSGEYSDDGGGSIIPIPVGASLTPLDIKLSDAQFAELKKYSCIQIAAAFGIKPQQIGDMTKTSYASSQAQNEAFYTDTLLYINKGYIEEIEAKCLGERDVAGGLFVEFDTSTVLKSSYESLIKSIDTAIKGSFMTPNEGRRQLGLPDEDGGSVLYANGNLIPLTLAGTQWQSQPDPAEGGEEQ